MADFVRYYLLMGFILAAIYDIWVDPKLGIQLPVKLRVLSAVIMIIGWLPIMLCSLYCLVTGKDVK